MSTRKMILVLTVSIIWPSICCFPIKCTVIATWTLKCL